MIRNNTFVGNSAELGQGGAVGVGGASVQVIGNTFWGNSIGLAYTGGLCHLRRRGRVRS